MKELKIALLNEDKDINYFKTCKKVGNGYEFKLVIREYSDDKKLIFEIEDLIKWKLVNVIILSCLDDERCYELGNKLYNLGFRGSIVMMFISDVVQYQVKYPSFYFGMKGESHDKCFEWTFMHALEYSKRQLEEYLILNRAGEYRQIKVNTIEYFEIRDHVVHVVYSEEKKMKSFEFISSLGKLEDQLFNRGFVRIHRSFLVASNVIQKMTYDSVTLMNGIVLPVGRKYSSKLREVMR